MMIGQHLNMGNWLDRRRKRRGRERTETTCDKIKDEDTIVKQKRKS